METNLVPIVIAIIIGGCPVVIAIIKWIVAPAISRRAAAKSVAIRKERVKKRPGACAGLEKLVKWASGQETEC